MFFSVFSLVPSWLVSLCKMLSVLECNPYFCCSQMSSFWCMYDFVNTTCKCCTSDANIVSGMSGNKKIFSTQHSVSKTVDCVQGIWLKKSSKLCGGNQSFFLRYSQLYTFWCNLWLFSHHMRILYRGCLEIKNYFLHNIMCPRLLTVCKEFGWKQVLSYVVEIKIFYAILNFALFDAICDFFHIICKYCIGDVWKLKNIFYPTFCVQDGSLCARNLPENKF